MQEFIKLNAERKVYGVPAECPDMFNDTSSDALYCWEIVNVALMEGIVSKDVNLIRTSRSLVSEKIRVLSKIVKNLEIAAINYGVEELLTNKNDNQEESKMEVDGPEGTSKQNLTLLAPSGPAQGSICANQYQKLDKIILKETAHNQKVAQRVMQIKEKEAKEQEKLDKKRQAEQEKEEKERKRKEEVEAKRKQEQEEKERKKEEAARLKREQEELKKKQQEEAKRQKEEEKRLKEEAALKAQQDKENAQKKLLSFFKKASPSKKEPIPVIETKTKTTNLLSTLQQDSEVGKINFKSEFKNLIKTCKKEWIKTCKEEHKVLANRPRRKDIFIEGSYKKIS